MRVNPDNILSCYSVDEYQYNIHLGPMQGAKSSNYLSGENETYLWSSMIFIAWLKHHLFPEFVTDEMRDEIRMLSI